jgi:hypothetical protein
MCKALQISTVFWPRPPLNQPGPFDFYIAQTSGNPRFFRGNGSANNAINGLSNVVAGQNYIVSGVARGTNLTAYLNGAFNGSSGVAAAGITDRGGPVKLARAKIL